MPAQPVPPPGAGFLAEQWGCIRGFHKELDEIRMETCNRCQERWFAMDLKDGICHSCFLRDKATQSNKRTSTLLLAATCNAWKRVLALKCRKSSLHSREDTLRGP